MRLTGWLGGEGRRGGREREREREGGRGEEGEGKGKRVGGS